MTTNNAFRSNVNFAEVNLTLNIAYTAGGPAMPTDVLGWIMPKLNANPEFAQVTATNVTGLLGWPDYLDAPMSTDHPDYPADCALLDKVNSWLTLDRQALVQALINAEAEKRQLNYKLDQKPF